MVRLLSVLKNVDNAFFGRYIHIPHGICYSNNTTGMMHLKIQKPLPRCELAECNFSPPSSQCTNFLRIALCKHPLASIFTLI